MILVYYKVLTSCHTRDLTGGLAPHSLNLVQVPDDMLPELALSSIWPHNRKVVVVLKIELPRVFSMNHLFCLEESPL
jgi:hypothetical protein